MGKRRYERRQAKQEGLESLRKEKVVKWSGLVELSNDTLGSLKGTLEGIGGGFNAVIGAEGVTDNDVTMAKEMCKQVSNVSSSITDMMTKVVTVSTSHADDVVSPDDTSDYLDLLMEIDGECMTATAITEHIIKTVDEMNSKINKENTNE